MYCMGRGLSDLQRSILRLALQNKKNKPNRYTDIVTQEIISDFFKSPTRAASASVSRALVRLENRGLLERQNNGWSLTEEGIITAHTLKRIQRKKSRPHREKIIEGEKRYKIIYADPPWKYKDKLCQGGGAESHYPCLTVDEICALPVSQIADRDSVLLLWTTGPQLDVALEVITCWGFTYKTVGFTWVKVNRRKGTLFMGMGRHTRQNAEFCLLAKRGKGAERLRKDIHSTQYHPLNDHSRKPAQFRKEIERLYGDVPRIELFAREHVPGWDVWGDELDYA